MPLPGGLRLGLLAGLLLLQPRLWGARGRGEGAQGESTLPAPSPTRSGGGRRDPGASPQTLPPVEVQGPSEAPESRVASVSPHLMAFAPGGSDSRKNLVAPRTPPPVAARATPEASPGCGHQRMRIVGGRPAAEEKWPWQVSLQIDDQHVCGGSLIANRWVMTAAHCILGHMDYTVKIGGIHVHHSSKGAVKVPVRDIVIHQDYETFQTIENDIALILLEFPVNYSSYIQPVCFPEKAFQVAADPKEAAPELLQEAEMSIIRHEKCNEIYKKKMGSRSDVVKKGCVCGFSALGKDACQGDSGGPLVCEFNNSWVQVGIVSWGIGCGRKGYPGVYTEVSFYKDWVIDRMGRAPRCSAGFLLLPLCLLLPLGILATP